MLESILEPFGNILLAVLGISFLIFIHELGHFLAARWFDVRVEVFSIGFGPRLLGWQSGDTDYRVSAIPLGGYVKMSGEYGDVGQEASLDPRDLMSKPIWQRVVVFCAGVAVNVAFAFVAFPVAFGAGVPFTAPVVGDLVPGGPAWKAGLRVGDEFLTVNGSRVYGFADVALEIALSDPAHTVARIRRDGHEFEQSLVPRSTEGDTPRRYDIGITPPRAARLSVDPEGPAARAGFLDGDRILAVDGVDLPAVPTGGHSLAPSRLGLAAYAGEQVRLTVARDGGPYTAEVRPIQRKDESERIVLGALALQTRVVDRRGRAAEPDFPLHVGDVLLGPPGRDVFHEGDIRDAATAARAAPGAMSMRLRRSDTLREVSLDDTQVQALLDGDLALGSDDTSTRIQVLPHGALAQAGLVDGDTILRVDDAVLSSYTDLLELVRLNNAAALKQVEFDVAYRHGEVERTVRVKAQPQVNYDYGLGLPLAEVVHDVSFMAAFRAGWDACINALRTTGLTLTKLFTGEVSADNLGGPLSISVITYQSAQWDLAKLLFFLALLSVNLAFINILPIPVLDGGQVMFLLCEKVKGSRLSDRFMQNAQLTGLVAILALMVYVTWNDIQRFVG